MNTVYRAGNDRVIILVRDSFQTILKWREREREKAIKHKHNTKKVQDAKSLIIYLHN